jgi:hypothetical protein
VSASGLRAAESVGLGAAVRGGVVGFLGGVSAGSTAAGAASGPLFAFGARHQLAYHVAQRPAKFVHPSNRFSLASSALRMAFSCAWKRSE